MVPPGDPEPLADAIVELLDDEPRRVALGARRSRRSPRSATRGTGIAGRLVEIYGSG